MTEAEELKTLLSEDAEAMRVVKLLETAIDVAAKHYVANGGNLQTLRRIVELKARIDVMAMLDREEDLPGPDAIIKKAAPWGVNKLVAFVFDQYIPKVAKVTENVKVVE